MKGVKLFRVLGIQISLNYTWFIVFGLIVWSLAIGYFPSSYPDLSRSAHLVMGFLGAFFLFLSVLVHELTHSYIAKKEGIEVKEITLFIFGGVSQLTKEPEDPKRELKIAIGGPLSSLVLALIFWITGLFENFELNSDCFIVDHSVSFGARVCSRGWNSFAAVGCENFSFHGHTS